MNDKQREKLMAMVERVRLSDAGMILTVILPRVGSMQVTHPAEEWQTNKAIRIEHSVAHQIRRRGIEMRLVLGGGIEIRRDDPALLKVVARGRCWLDALVEGRAGSATELAREAGVTARHVQRIVWLGLLAPTIVEAITAGRQEAGLTVDALEALGTLPLRWSEQVTHLGN